MKTNCQHCRKTFKTKPHRIRDGRGKYCSKNCFDNHRRETDLYKGKNNKNYNQIQCTCINCEKKFLRVPSEINNYGGKYCSKKCHYEHRKSTGSFKGDKHPRYNPIERICRHCGKTFLTKKCLAEKGLALYCNKDCREKDHRPINRTCRCCGKEFLIYKSRLKEKDITRGRTIERGSFCSRVCLDKARSEFQEYLGENHCNWTGGYFPYYGEKWRAMRRAILKRANKASEIGHENGEKLHIHHIIPLKNYINKYLELCVTPYIEHIKYITFDILPFDLIPNIIFEEANSPDNLMVLTIEEHKLYEGMPIGFFNEIQNQNKLNVEENFK